MVRASTTLIRALASGHGPAGWYFEHTASAASPLVASAVTYVPAAWNEESVVSEPYTPSSG